MIETIDILKRLIACPSITPEDAGCQLFIADLLNNMGFKTEKMRFGQVDNLWATYGSGQPLIVFAGHTDVVPPGPTADWDSEPFVPEIRDAYLYGRGACDMKGALAAMVFAVNQFLSDTQQFSGTLAFLITSDEEGPSIHGTRQVLAELTQRGVKIDYAIIGEPSSDQKLGDQIRIGRRGSLHGKLIIHGKQGHVANPHLATNPIHRSMCRLHELAHTKWDEGNADFPATSFQITNIHSGTGALNVIPGHIEIDFNFRYSTAVTTEQLIARTEALLQPIGLPYDIEWTIGAEPFLTRKGKLINATEQAIQLITGLHTRLSTGGGTSDARFIAQTGAEVIELGVSNATAHQVNECVLVADLRKLPNIYSQIIKNLLLSK